MVEFIGISPVQYRAHSQVAQYLIKKCPIFGVQYSETLAYLAFDKHPVIRRNVAINKNTLPSTLELLGAERYDFGIQYFVAHNENTPKEARERLRSKLPKHAWPETPSIVMLHSYYEDDQYQEKGAVSLTAPFGKSYFNWK